MLLERKFHSLRFLGSEISREEQRDGRVGHSGSGDFSLMHFSTSESSTDHIFTQNYEARA